MGNNLERGIPNIPETPESVAQENITRRKMLQFCGAAAALALLETAGASKLEAATEEKERFESGINYTSEEAQAELEQYERFYEDLKDSEIPVIIGTSEDITKHLSDEWKAKFQVGQLNTMAFAYHAQQMSDKAIDRLQLQENAVYIQFHNIEGEKKEDAYRIAYHEGRHARHQIDYHKDNPDARTGVIRFSEISEIANKYIEEMVTNEETINFLLDQQKDLENSILTEEEQVNLGEQIKREKIYCMENYLKYYKERYGKDTELPCGEWAREDEVDTMVEKIWVNNNLNETLAEKYGK